MASMKCSSQRNCNRALNQASTSLIRPQRSAVPGGTAAGGRVGARDHESASMKRSSRRNCSLAGVGAGGQGEASMKCSSRRNCSPRGAPTRASYPHCLNEVQFPEELQPADTDEVGAAGHRASMKCSSRRNCSPGRRTPPPRRWSLNEVQFPEELQLLDLLPHRVELRVASMKCSSRRNCSCT